MNVGKKVKGILDKYRDEEYLNNAFKYVLIRDLEEIGILIKPNYDTNILREIMSVVIRRMEDE